MWDVEDSTRLDIVVYQAAGAKPVFEYNDATGVSTILKTAFFMPVYQPYSGDILDPDHDADKIGWMLSLNKDQSRFDSGDDVIIHFNNPIVEDVGHYRFVGSGLVSSPQSDLKKQIDMINVFPNPYFGANPEEINPQNRRIFFTHLGTGTSTIRIFNLAGDLVGKVVKTIDSENLSDRRAEWDLRNQAGVPVASGMYIAHVEVKDLAGKSLGEKVLKFAVMQPQERLDIY